MQRTETWFVKTTYDMRNWLSHRIATTWKYYLYFCDKQFAITKSCLTRGLSIKTCKFPMKTLSATRQSLREKMSKSQLVVGGLFWDTIRKIDPGKVAGKKGVRQDLNASFRRDPVWLKASKWNRSSSHLRLLKDWILEKIDWFKRFISFISP